MRESKPSPPLAWHAILDLVGHAASGLVVLLVCVFAWLLPGRLGALCVRALAAYDPDARGLVRRRTAGIAMGGYLFALFAGLAVAVGADAGEPDLVHRVVAEMMLPVLVPAALGAACAPFALAPFVVLRSGTSLLEGFRRSFELAARRGAKAALVEGGATGALLGVVTWTAGPMGAITGDAVTGWMVALVIAWVVVLPAAALVQARAYVDAIGRPAFDPAHHPEVRRAVISAVLAIAPALAALATAFALAIATPTPMRETPTGLRERVAVLPHTAPDEVAIGGPHGLRVYRVPDGVVIETEDGGGAGHVRASVHDPAPLYGFVVGRLPIAGRPVYAAFVDQESRVVLFDESGVRLDDGIGARLGRRLGLPGIAMIVVLLALLLKLAQRLLRALEEAAMLDAPDLGSLPVADGRRLVFVPARLRVSEHARVRVGRRRASIEGEARLEVAQGSVWIAVPSEVPLIGAGDGTAIEDGAEAALVAPLARLAPAGLRQGAMPWPEGGRLAIGPRAHVAELLVRRTIAGVSRGGLAFGALTLATAAWMFWRL
jgi:hypothetical protein